MSSSIEWTGSTWNPLAGCSKISPGCKNCYAINMAWRLMHIGKMKEKYADTVKKGENGKLNWTGKVNLDLPALNIPLKTKKPTTYFVNSMSDLFHVTVPFEFIDKVFAVMMLCPQHTFQILTKRPHIAEQYFLSREDTWYYWGKQAQIIASDNPECIHVVKRLNKDAYKATGSKTYITNELLPHMKNAGWFWDQSGEYKDSELLCDGPEILPNVWMGASAENQEELDLRLAPLLRIKAAVRFLSLEPLLSKLDLLGSATRFCDKPRALEDLHWVIVGGESGNNARPMHPDWLTSIIHQLQQVGIPLFFKQWGKWASGYTRNGKMVFRQFENFNQWVNLASSWVCGGICLDSDGVQLKIGRDMMRARDEGKFPVIIMHKVTVKAEIGGIEYKQFPKN